MALLVKQPNGLLAIWGSVTDSFLALNLSPDEAVEEFYDAARFLKREAAQRRARQVLAGGDGDWYDNVTLYICREDADEKIVGDLIDLSDNQKLLASLRDELRWSDVRLSHEQERKERVEAMMQKLGQSMEER